MTTLLERRRGHRKGPEIGIAPLVDLVFLLLIFFLLSSTLEKEKALPVRRPQASTAETLSQPPLAVTVTAAGTLHMEGRRVSLAELETSLRAALSSVRDRRILLVADREARAGLVVRVMDVCRRAGGQVLLATARPSEPFQKETGTWKRP